MSLRTKLVLALVVCTSLASAGVGALSYTATAQRLEAEIDASLEQIVASVLRDLGGSRPGSFPGRGFLGTGEIEVQMLAADGQTRARVDASPLPVEEADLTIASAQARGVQGFRDDELDGEPVRMLTESVGGGRGAVQAARSAEESQRVLSALRSRILGAALAVAAAAALAGWVIARQITGRLTRVTSAAEHVAATGTLDVAVPVEGDDESARLGTAFNEMLAALSQSRADQQRLVQDAGHELRTPMTSLRTNLYALRSLDTLDEETRAAVLGDLELETEELSRLINEVVEVATDRRGDEPVTEVDLTALAQRVSQRASVRWNRVVSVHAAGPAVVAGRRESLGRALRNLVENACKFDRSRREIEVSVGPTAATSGAPAGVSVVVLDRGPGLEAADVEHVFERFYRAESARALPGSGLGLSIVAEVVAAHGGTCSASVRPGGGAQVSFWVPVD